MEKSGARFEQTDLLRHERPDGSTELMIATVMQLRTDNSEYETDGQHAVQTFRHMRCVKQTNHHEHGMCNGVINANEDLNGARVSAVTLLVYLRRFDSFW